MGQAPRLKCLTQATRKGVSDAAEISALFEQSGSLQWPEVPSTAGRLVAALRVGGPGAQAYTCTPATAPRTPSRLAAPSRLFLARWSQPLPRTKVTQGEVPLLTFAPVLKGWKALAAIVWPDCTRGCHRQQGDER